MGCWVRTAAAARRSGPRPTGAGRRRRAARRHGSREAVRAGRSRRAGVRRRHAAPTGRPDDAAAPGPAAAWPWRTAARRRRAASLLAARVPRLRPARPRRRSAPAALALAVRGQRFRSGLWLGLVFGARLLRAAAVLDRHLRRPAPVAGPGGCGGRCTSPCSAAPPRSTSRLRWWPLWTAALWVADEALRGRFVLGGFPWGRLGFSQTEGPLLSLAAYGGVPLVSFAVALTGTLLAAAVLAAGPRLAARVDRRDGGAAARRSAPRALRGRRRARRAAGRGAGLAAAARPVAHRRRPDATVAVIQGNVPRAGPGLQRPAPRRARQPRRSRPSSWPPPSPRASRPQPDLVIWPENSSDIDPYLNEDAARADRPGRRGDRRADPGRARSSTARGGSSATPRSSGTPTTARGTPTSSGTRCRSPSTCRPASFFRIFSDEVDRVRRDFAAGDEVGVLDVGGARIGDLICFEVVYDGLVHDVVDGGAGMLVVQTNNATFGFTDESEQQLAMSRLRAVEYGRTVAIAATSGISAIVAPDGSRRPLVGAVHPGGLRRGHRPARLAPRSPCGSARPRSGR